MARVKLTRELDSVWGHLRSGHLELIVDENEWDSMSDDDKREFFKHNAQVMVDDYYVNDHDVAEDSAIEEELC